ncbi:MAG: GLUG motif-containing protein [Planctomycetota bacterium]
MIDPNVDAGTGDYVGSLVGSLREGAVTGCYVAGGSIEGDLYVGGLVGTNSFHGLTIYGTITNCYSTAFVSGNGYVGGLVGLNCESTITNCCSTGTVSGNSDDNYYVGGLVGRNCRGIITNCYSTASVAGDSYISGLVGYNEGTITNSYAVGSVEGEYCVGGLAGHNGTTWGEGAITNCYSAGKVSGDHYVGGLVGYKSGYVVNSFWDIERSGQAISAAGEGKTTAQMRMADTFLNWGSCGQVWTINEGVDYPRLAWQQRPGEPIVGIIPFEGDGSPNNPYLIHTAQELNAIRLFPCVWDKHFRLMANIDLSQYTGTEFNIIVHFSGTFDGNGHTISNFTYISKDTGYLGLFGDVSGHIKNLGLIDPNVDAETERRVGLLVGLLDNGAVTNCYVEGGSVSGHVFIGGLVGLNDYGTISECYSTGSVSGDLCVGGLVGRNDSGTISKSYSIASVSGDRILGGLAGENKDTITNCYAMGSVSGNREIGGLVGYNWKATITNCYATSSVSGIEYDVGALVGYDREGSYTKSFWDKTVNSLLTGIGSGVNPDVIGESTANMQKESTFADAGWDFGQIRRRQRPSQQSLFDIHGRADEHNWCLSE